MTRVLVRFAKRLASWETDRPVEELRELEFKKRNGEPDTEPSFYEISDEQPVVERAYAEHAAAAPIDPERQTIGIDCMGCRHEVRGTDGNAYFEFTRTSHREVVLPDLAGLHSFIADLHRRSRDAAHRRTVTKDAVHAYARARVAAQDPEWVAVASRPDAKGWVRRLLKK